MVVAVGAVLVSLLELTDLLAEGALALLAEEYELECGNQLVILGLRVALRTVEPFLAAGGTDRHLRVQNMLAHFQ